MFDFAVLAIFFYIGFSVFVPKDFDFSVVVAVCGFFVF